MMNKSKKFRFDSFATEFSEDKQDIPDNDSGIGEFFFFIFILHIELGTYLLILSSNLEKLCEYSIILTGCKH